MILDPVMVIDFRNSTTMVLGLTLQISRAKLLVRGQIDRPPVRPSRSILRLNPSLAITTSLLLASFLLPGKLFLRFITEVFQEATRHILAIAVLIFTGIFRRQSF
jgi:hypothetical protein